MYKNLVIMITTVAVLVFLLASLYAWFGMSEPECYAGLPGMFALGYIIGEWCHDLFK